MSSIRAIYHAQAPLAIPDASPYWLPYSVRRITGLARPSVRLFVCPPVHELISV